MKPNQWSLNWACSWLGAIRITVIKRINLAGLRCFSHQLQSLLFTFHVSARGMQTYWACKITLLYHVQLHLNVKSKIWQGSEPGLFHFHLPGKYLSSQVCGCMLDTISLQQQLLSKLVPRPPAKYTNDRRQIFTCAEIGKSLGVIYLSFHISLTMIDCIKPHFRPISSPNPSPPTCCLVW